MTPSKMTDEELGKRFREIVTSGESKTDYNSSMLISLKHRWRTLYDLILEIK